jgi:AcrR family transcriptional regulator
VGRPKDPEGTIASIRDATLKLVREKGCVNLTFEDLMGETGLSKGAIFHHVRGKSQLLTLALRELLEKADRQLGARLADSSIGLDELIKEFRLSMAALEDSGSPENRILKYLLSHEDEEEVSELLSRFFDDAVDYSTRWIEAGKRAGFFASDLPSASAAELIVTVNFGLRMRSGIGNPGGARFGAEEFLGFMVSYLEGVSK